MPQCGRNALTGPDCATTSRPADPASAQITASATARTPKVRAGSLPSQTKASGAAMAPTPKVAFSRLSIDGPLVPKARMTRGLNTAVAMP